MKKIRVKDIICIIILIILLPIIFVSAVILIDSIRNPEEVPSFFGWKPFIVMNDSMNGTINEGDIVVVKECDLSEISENDIISSLTVERHKRLYINVCAFLKMRT